MLDSTERDDKPWEGGGGMQTDLASALGLLQHKQRSRATSSTLTMPSLAQGMQQGSPVVQVVYHPPPYSKT